LERVRSEGVCVSKDRIMPEKIFACLLLRFRKLKGPRRRWRKERGGEKCRISYDLIDDYWEVAGGNDCLRTDDVLTRLAHGTGSCGRGCREKREGEEFRHTVDCSSVGGQKVKVQGLMPFGGGFTVLAFPTYSLEIQRVNLDQSSMQGGRGG